MQEISNWRKLEMNESERKVKGKGGATNLNFNWKKRTTKYCSYTETCYNNKILFLMYASRIKRSN